MEAGSALSEAGTDLSVATSGLSEAASGSSEAGSGLSERRLLTMSNRSIASGQNVLHKRFRERTIETLKEEGTPSADYHSTSVH